ncbi:alpha/beta hydrolase [Leuconostoc gasicomitatum]|uniref:alpha/beta hydrolase n=1 Tax=Leuconostoc gasicomitatum TaxID=115778 RepID=UPI000744D1D0|nr:alpha/beta hydrolase [Leuconostoc gasicomitatum]MBZ5948134.1 alpha/beta hydrolase [Leuconostoc gasicomitatum]CUR63563.1 Putative esterase/lipase [Leuconostoc gasicomitatum KG16-1]CUW05404.1 lipase, putative [Leuconostoc gasicomitatum]
MFQKIKKYLKWFVILLSTVIIIVTIAFTVSPWPSAYVIGRMFNGPVKITDKSVFEQAKKNVTVKSDVRYESTVKNNTLDIYTPKKETKPVTTLIWVHGGGYVAGDKSGLREFATKLVNDTHVAVVSINYQTAPSAIYPSQVRQVNDAIIFLKMTPKYQQKLNLSRVMFGGDSAGAQIALQYAAIQTNARYAEEMAMPAELENGQIKGTISYCGPLDLQQVTNQQSKSLFMRWFINTVAWSELGDRNWRESYTLQQASLVKQITSQFPPTYITDGNAYSFQEQGLAFEKRLQYLHVPVTSLFFNHVQKEVTHEYQFNYQTSLAQKCYEETRHFVMRYQ